MRPVVARLVKEGLLIGLGVREIALLLDKSPETVRFIKKGLTYKNVVVGEEVAELWKAAQKEQEEAEILWHKAEVLHARGEITKTEEEKAFIRQIAALEAAELKKYVRNRLRLYVKPQAGKKKWDEEVLAAWGS